MGVGVRYARISVGGARRLWLVEHNSGGGRSRPACGWGRRAMSYSWGAGSLKEISNVADS